MSKVRDQAKREDRLRTFLRSGTAPIGRCPHCEQPGKHFVPASLGEPGFYLCLRTVPAL